MTKKKAGDIALYVLLIALVLLFLFPIAFVVVNSFKSKLFISSNPFGIPSGESFAKFGNYTEGIEKTNFFGAFGWSAFITVGSVVMILLFTSMTAWYITRVKSKVTSCLYYMP